MRKIRIPFKPETIYLRVRLFIDKNTTMVYCKPDDVVFYKNNIVNVKKGYDTYRIVGDYDNTRTGWCVKLDIHYDYYRRYNFHTYNDEWYTTDGFHITELSEEPEWINTTQEQCEKELKEHQEKFMEFKKALGVEGEWYKSDFKYKDAVEQFKKRK